MNPEAILIPELWQLRDLFRARGFDLRLVGGCVRDLLHGVMPKDVDLHTDATPAEQQQIYDAAGVRWEPTGLSHGTVSVIFHHVAYEITTLRKDVATDGRHATVEFVRNWEADCLRRDFTINAMSMGFEGDLLDPFGGAADLENGVVRFVGDPAERIREDYLRILRWYRFRGRFGVTPDPVCRSKVVAARDGLTRISVERIWSELQKILTGPNALEILEQMQLDDVMGVCKLPRGRFIYTGRAKRMMALHKPRPETVLTTLYPWGDLKDMFEKLKTSKESMDLLTNLHIYGNPYSDISLKYLLAVQRLSRDTVKEIAKARCMDPFDVMMLDDIPIPRFPVKGDDLMAMGVPPGPELGKLLRELKDFWADNDYTEDKQMLLKAWKELQQANEQSE